MSSIFYIKYAKTRRILSVPVWHSREQHELIKEGSILNKVAKLKEPLYLGFSKSINNINCILKILKRVFIQIFSISA